MNTYGSSNTTFTSFYDGNYNVMYNDVKNIRVATCPSCKKLVFSKNDKLLKCRCGYKEPPRQLKLF